MGGKRAKVDEGMDEERKDNTGEEDRAKQRVNRIYYLQCQGSGY